MTIKITYRVSSTEEPADETTIKGEPLTNYEIDRNWKTVVDELDRKAEKLDSSLTGTPVVNSTTAFGLPVGSSDERPEDPKNGMMRYNSTNNQIEFYSNGNWEVMNKSASGGDTDEVFFLNDMIVKNSYKIPSGKNAMTAGPITITNDAVIEVSQGSTWTIV